MGNYLDNIKKRASQKKIKEASGESLKSPGELETLETKGVGLPKGSASVSSPEQLKANGELDKKEEAGVGLNPSVKAEADEVPVKDEPAMSDDKDKDKPLVAEEDEEDVADDKKEDEEDFKLDEEDEEKAEKSEEDKKKEKEAEDAVMKEHVDALLSGENLSEEFQAKVKTVFEAAVKSSVKKEKEKIVEKAKKKLVAIKEANYMELAEQLDSYLDYITEQWLSDNKLAVEHAIRTEITEEFISDLKVIFEKHNIDIPASKYDLVDEMQSSLTESENKLNEEIKNGIRLKRRISQLEKKIVVAEMCEGLTAVESDKFKSLAEEISYDGVDDLRKKVSQLKESYFQGNSLKSAKIDTIVEDENGKAVGLSDKVVVEEAKEETTAMSAYLGAIKKISKNK